MNIILIIAFAASLTLSINLVGNMVVGMCKATVLERGAAHKIQIYSVFDIYATVIAWTFFFAVCIYR